MLRFVAKAFGLRGQAVDKAGGPINSEAGAAAIEYCLLAGMIALVIVAGLRLLGNSLNLEFQKITPGLS